MTNSLLRRQCLLTLIPFLCIGCGAGEPERKPVYPVSGTVTQDGKPLEGAVVTFAPSTKEGKAAVGTTGADGKYTLTTWSSGDGAEAGSYSITVTKYEAPAEEAEQPATTSTAETDPDSYVLQEEYPEDYDEMEASDQEASKNLLPEKYANPSTSGFTATVTEDATKNVFDFSLEG